MSGYITPMLLVTGVSFANHWYNTNQIDLKIPLEGAIATLILGLVSNIDGFSDVAAGIAWVAFVAVMIAPVQKPPPIQNLLKIIGNS